MVEDGPCSYRFTGHQLRALANLMRRVGLMLWQQALLFPSHITKLGTLRLDEPCNLRVEEVRQPGGSTGACGCWCCGPEAVVGGWWLVAAHAVCV